LQCRTNLQVPRPLPITLAHREIERANQILTLFMIPGSLLQRRWTKDTHPFNSHGTPSRSKSKQPGNKERGV
jgi:hypothetical protein